MKCPTPPFSLVGWGGICRCNGVRFIERLSYEGEATIGSVGGDSPRVGWRPCLRGPASTLAITHLHASFAVRTSKVRLFRGNTKRRAAALALKLSLTTIIHQSARFAHRPPRALYDLKTLPATAAVTLRCLSPRQFQIFASKPQRPQ
jgi:hypothetical protein